MRIGYNCLAVDPAYAGGVNTYVFGLLEGFREAGAEHQFSIYVTERNRKLFEKYESLPNFSLKLVTEYQSFPRKLLSRVALETGWAWLYEWVTNLVYGSIGRRIDREVDIFYTPTTALFPLNCKRPTAVSIHDIQQIHYPNFFSKRELRRRKVLFGLTEKRATYIQASSEFIRKDWHEHFTKTPLENIFVAHEGVDFSEFSAKNEKTKEILKHYLLPARFLFYPAQLWYHKNHITVLKALKEIRDESGLEIPLILTGQSYSSSVEIFGYIQKSELNFVRYLGKVPFKELKALYAEASFLITAVLYESSSLCILEAAASGTPVIASDTPPNREMSEHLSMYLFSPLDVRELKKVLLSAWHFDEAAVFSAKGNLARVTYYSWKNAATAYLSFFESKLK